MPARLISENERDRLFLLSLINEISDIIAKIETNLKVFSTIMKETLTQVQQKQVINREEFLIAIKDADNFHNTTRLELKKMWRNLKGIRGRKAFKIQIKSLYIVIRKSRKSWLLIKSKLYQNHDI